MEGAMTDKEKGFFPYWPKPQPISWWKKLIIKTFGKRYIGTDATASAYTTVVVSYYYKGNHYIFETY